MFVEILEEYRRGSLAVFLEKTTDALDGGAYRVKAVRIRRFISEEAARQEFERAIHPRLARETQKPAKGGQPKNENR